MPLRHLVDVRESRRPVVPEQVADARQAALWHAKQSALVRPGWDRKFSALTDAVLEAVPARARRRRGGLDVTGPARRRRRAAAAARGGRAPGPPAGHRPLARGAAAPRARGRRRGRPDPGVRDLVAREPRRDRPADGGRARPAPARVRPALPPRPAADPGRGAAGARQAAAQAGGGVRGGRRPAARVAAADRGRGPAAGRPRAPGAQVEPLGPRRDRARRARPRRRVGQARDRRLLLPLGGLPARGAGGDGGRRPGGHLRRRVRSARARASTRSTACWSAPSRSPASRRPCCAWPPTPTSAPGSARVRCAPPPSTPPRSLAERWVGVFADARAARAGRGRLTARAAARPPRARARPGLGPRRLDPHPGAGTARRADLGRRGRPQRHRHLAGDARPRA